MLKKWGSRKVRYVLDPRSLDDDSSTLSSRSRESGGGGAQQKRRSVHVSWDPVVAEEEFADGDGDDNSEPGTPGPPLVSGAGKGKAKKQVAFMVTNRKQVRLLRESSSLPRTRSEYMRQQKIHARPSTPRAAPAESAPSSSSSTTGLRFKAGPRDKTHRKAGDLLLKHVETMATKGKILRHTFNAADLGFSVALGRSDKSDRVMVHVKEIRADCELAELRPSDELVAINGEFFVPTRLIADFKYLEEIFGIAGPRPLDLAFVHGDRRDTPPLKPARDVALPPKLSLAVSDLPPPKDRRAREHLYQKLEKAEAALAAKTKEVETLREKLSTLSRDHADIVKRFEAREADLRRQLTTLQPSLEIQPTPLETLETPRPSLIATDFSVDAIADATRQPQQEEQSTSEPNSPLPPPVTLQPNLANDEDDLEEELARALESGDASLIRRYFEQLEEDDDDDDSHDEDDAPSSEPLRRANSLDDASMLRSTSFIIPASSENAALVSQDSLEDDSTQEDASQASDVVVFLSSEHIPNLADILRDREAELRREFATEMSNLLATKDDTLATLQRDLDQARASLAAVGK